MKHTFKTISVILIFTMLFTMLPLNVFAQELIAQDESIKTPLVTQIGQKPVDVKIIGEVVEKREKNIKHFLKEDMTFEADIYPIAVHYKEDGQWKDIDNTLIEKKDSSNNNVFENKSNSFKVNIAKDAKANKLVNITKDEFKLSWSLNQASEFPKKTSAIPVEINSLTPSEGLSQNDEKKILHNLSSSVEYTDIFNNVDLKYTIESESLKEYIILKQKTDNSTFIFKIDTHNLNAQLLDDGSIIFADISDNGDEVFRIPPPFMYDDSGTRSNDIKVSLEKSDSGYILSLIPDRPWIESPDRVYPVIIDPVITVNSTKDTHVSENYPDTPLYGYPYLGVGNKYSYYKERIYIMFDLPSLQASDFITNAYMYLYLPQCFNEDLVKVQKVLGGWNYTSLTWNNQPESSPTIEDYERIYQYSDPSYPQLHEWDITGITKDWYKTGNNYGLMLCGTTQNGYCTFYSYEYCSGSYGPRATISYISSAGLEDYWTYHSQETGRAGTGYINDTNGNLIFIHTDLSMNGNRMPATINHVYNSCNKDSDMGFGLGWRLNITQRLSSQTQWFLYTDEDGTIHYFDKTSGYYDSGTSSYIYPDTSGLNFKLYDCSADGYYAVKDKKGNQIVFNRSFYPTSIKDNNDNALTFEYDVDGITLKTVTDGAGRVTSLNYSGGKLSNIKDPSDRYTYFYYTGTNLTQITYPDGNNSIYTYDINNNLLSVTNFDGYKIIYTYSTSSPNRVIKVEEKNTDGTLGEELDINHLVSETKFTDVSGRTETYLFSNYGNTIAIRDWMGYAQSYKYLRGSNINNKLSISSKLQGSIINYLLGHNCELPSSSYWTAGSEGGSSGSCSLTTEDKYIGYRSFKIQKTNTSGRHFYNQQLTLTKGKDYVFSGYIKTNAISNANNKGAALSVIYQDASGIWQTIDSQYVNDTTNWQRIEFKFTLPQDAMSSTVYAEASIIEETGTAYFDCFQLEAGPITNRYNLVENPDFTYGTDTPISWTKGPYGENDTLVTLTDPQYPPSLDSKCYKINGDPPPSWHQSISQRINVSGNKNDVFTVCGWIYANLVPSGSAEIWLTFDGYECVSVKFNNYCSGWQYISEKILAPRNYQFIDIEANINYQWDSTYAYFDGIQLYKEEYGTSYQYDTNGNVISTIDLASQNTQFQYNTSNDMIKMINPKGNEINYTYDSKHNLLNAVTSENVTYSFTYDTYGNPLTVKDGNDTLFVKSTSTYTSNGNYLSTVTDPSGNTVTYGYNQTKGTLNSLTDPNNKTTSYTYDTNLDRLISVSKTADNQQVSNSYSYQNDRLSQISHNNFNYNFSYDSLGNPTVVSVGSQALLSNTYESRTSKLLQSAYGNGQNISYDYDNLDRVTTKKYNGNTKYKYAYDANGNGGYHEDLVNNVIYKYLYDMADRLVKVSDSTGNISSFTYDNNNNISSISDKINNNTFTTTFEYDRDDRQKKVTANCGGYASYSYDALGRLNTGTINAGSAQYNTTYSYLAGINGSSTLKLGNIDNNGSSISYTYDANGNIETVIQGGQTIRYYYNELNELIREDNQPLNKTIVYAYDVGGNFTSKIEYPYTTGVPSNPTKTYSYAYDNTWKDKMTSFDGKTITYDQIGNPLTYDGWTYTWEMGRQLASMSKTGESLSFKYNDAGIRTQKVYNGVTTNYHLVGDRVTYQTDGTDAMYFTYDVNGRQVSMNLNGTEYYYVRNGQGDIIGLLDSTGTQIVSYTYDTWGKLISITGTLANTVGVKNPYRYRGYRYDTETGLYYLQSRYYSPEWGRFINADSVLGYTGELLSYNLFTYCANNPVIGIDPDGHFFMLVTAAIGAVIGGVTGAVVSLVKTGKVDLKTVATGALIGGAIGLSGGAATALITTGSVFASTSTVIGALGYGGTAAVAGGGGALYQVTSNKAAEIIQKTGQLVGSAQEAKQVFAFTQQPTLQQAANSGARALETVIKFETKASFIPDKSLVNTALQKIAVKSANTLPVIVRNVKKVGFKK